VLSSFLQCYRENRKEVDTDRKQKVVVVAKHRKEVDADPQEIDELDTSIATYMCVHRRYNKQILINIKQKKYLKHICLY
jgi:hypothetical protein